MGSAGPPSRFPCRCPVGASGGTHVDRPSPSLLSPPLSSASPCSSSAMPRLPGPLHRCPRWQVGTLPGNAGPFLNGAHPLDPSLSPAQDGIWEARCSLLLWLSMLLIIPFDLATVDTALAGVASFSAHPHGPLPRAPASNDSVGSLAAAAGGVQGAAAAPASAAGVPPLVRRVLDICERFLGDPGAVR